MSEYAKNILPNGMTARELYAKAYASTKHGAYGARSGRHSYLAHVLKEMEYATSPTKPPSFLDVGCGRGGSMEVAHESKLFHKVRGCDIVPALRKEDVDLIASAAELPYEDDSYTVVVMLDVIEHLQPADEWKDAIFECLRVAEKKAVFSICCVPDKWGPALGVGPLHINLRPIPWWKDWFEYIVKAGKIKECRFMDPPREKDVTIWVECDV